MCKKGQRVVFDLDEDGNNLSYALNKQTGDRMTFALKNKVWEIHAEIAPPVLLETDMQGLKRALNPASVPMDVNPFLGQVLLP